MSEIVVYNEFREKISVLKKENAELVFEYETKEGDKAARSHVANLRKLKARLEEARIAEKKTSLEYGKKVDTEAKQITADIEDMIEVHQSKLDAIKQREADRIQKIKDRISKLEMAAQPNPYDSIESLQFKLDEVKKFVVDDTLEEYEEAALNIKNTAILMLEGGIALAEKKAAEAAAAEKARIKAEKDAQKEREAKLKADAAAKATREAETKAKAEREAAAARELELKSAAERAEADKKAAEHRAAVAVENERRRVEAEAAALAAAEAKREQSVKHQKKIHGEIMVVLKERFRLADEDAKDLIIAIRKGEIPHISIAY